MFGLGALLLLSRNISDAAAIPAAVATGGVLSVIALLALTVDETDEAFADIYSTAVSIQNVFPGLPQRLLIALVAATATAGALVLDLQNYQTFLFLLGSFFVPLLGVLIADWLLAGLHYDRRAIFEGPSGSDRPDRGVARRVRRLPVAAPARAELVARPDPPHEGAGRLQRLAPELRHRVPPGPARRVDSLGSCRGSP